MAPHIHHDIKNTKKAKIEANLISHVYKIQQNKWPLSQIDDIHDHARHSIHQLTINVIARKNLGHLHKELMFTHQSFPHKINTVNNCIFTLFVMSYMTIAA
jgi:hypothetical protein